MNRPLRAQTSMRIPSRFIGVSFVGDGSLNGNAVAPKAIRWWFVLTCLSAAWASGDSVSRSSFNESD